MANIIFTGNGRCRWNIDSGLNIVEYLQRLGLDPDDWYAVCDGRLLAQGEVAQAGKSYQLCLRLPGGKGGFGSMLRAIGAQIEKTTSREACRDLSGRRMRDVNNEKQLKEWISKQSEREKEKERKRQEKMERRRAKPQHKFEDPDYHEQRSKVANDLQDALQTGLQKMQSTDSSAILGKRKAESAMAGPSKKKCEWLGIDAEGLSSEDSDLDEEPVCHRNSDAPATVTSSDDTSSPQHQDSGSADSSGEESSNSGERPTSSAALSEDSSEPMPAPEDETERAPREEDSSSSSGCAGEAEPAASSKEDSSKQHPLLASLPAPVCSEPSKQQAEATGPVVLEDFASAQELEALGLERLKAALMERGMKCGGTLQERAQRLFSVKGVPLEKIDPSLLAKPSKGKRK